VRQVRTGHREIPGLRSLVSLQFYDTAHRYGPQTMPSENPQTI